jgi:hypothetical protein
MRTQASPLCESIFPDLEPFLPRGLVISDFSVFHRKLFGSHYDKDYVEVLKRGHWEGLLEQLSPSNRGERDKTIN